MRATTGQQRSSEPGSGMKGAVNNDWEDASCTLCGARDAEPVLTIPHLDAPNGLSHIVRCTGCGLRRLDPRPGPNAIGRYYADDYGAYAGRQRGVAKQAVWDFLRDISSGAPGRARRLKVLQPIARRLAHWAFDINVCLEGLDQPRVLEIGCGYGDLLLYLKTRGCVVQGVDSDPRAAARGREYGVPIHVGRVQDLKLPADSIDVAVLCHSLEHLPDPTETLAELRRIVKPGGSLHIAVPNGRAVGLQQEGQAWGCLFHPIHFWYFDEITLGQLLQTHGFSATQVARATVWKNHWTLWRSRWRASGPVAVTRQALRYCRELARDREGGDILRVAAVKTA